MTRVVQITNLLLGIFFLFLFANSGFYILARLDPNVPNFTRDIFLLLVTFFYFFIFVLLFQKNEVKIKIVSLLSAFQVIVFIWLFVYDTFFNRANLICGDFVSAQGSPPCYRSFGSDVFLELLLALPSLVTLIFCFAFNWKASRKVIL